MHAFHLEMRTIVYFHSNLLVSGELVAEGYQGIPVKCISLEMRDRKTLPGLINLCFSKFARNNNMLGRLLLNGEDSITALQ